MSKPFIARSTRLVIALAVLSISGCALFGSGGEPLEVLRNEVLLKVHDVDRAEAMLADIDNLDSLLMQSAELLAEAARKERALFFDYDSTPEDFEALFSDTAHKRQDLQEAMLDVHLAFKSKSTAEEWESLLPIHASAVAARINSLVKVAIEDRG